MTLNKCTICNKKTTTKCAKFDFTENNPRPADEYLSTHKLGILFPVESTSPELIWVKNTITFEEVGSHWEVWPKLNKHIKCLTSPFVSVLQDRNVEVYISDMCCIEDGPNECLGHLLESYQWTDGGNPVSEYKWASNVVVLRSRSYDRNEPKDGENKVFEDVTLADFRSALTYMGSTAKLYEPEKESRFLMRDEKEWVRGVKISCVGDMEVLEHMGMTLRVFKCGYQRKVVDANNARKTKRHPFDSAMASILMINANPEESNQGWGWADIKNWDSGTEPTVLVTRSDKKPISAKQVEVLIEYIRCVVQWAMEPDEIDEEYEKMQEKSDNDEITATEFFEFEENNTEENRRKRVIEEYMKSDRFEKFIEKFKKEKLADGDTTWVDVVSPRAG